TNNIPETQVATLLKSTDGGATWTNASIPTNEPVTTPQIWTFGDGEQQVEPNALPDGALAYLQSPPLLLDSINTQRLLTGTDYPAGTGLYDAPVGSSFGNFLTQSLTGGGPVW